VHIDSETDKYYVTIKNPSLNTRVYTVTVLKCNTYIYTQSNYKHKYMHT